MVNYNLMSVTATIDDSACLKHMVMVKAPLQTVYDGKIENLRLHIQDFTRCIQTTGLYREFIIWMQENQCPNDIPEVDWTVASSLLENRNFLENFNEASFKTLVKEKE